MAEKAKETEQVQPCPECSGRKVIEKTDFKHAKTTTIRCPACHGSGLTIPKEIDGVYQQYHPGRLVDIVYKHKKKIVSSIMAVVRPVQPPQSKIIKTNPADLPKGYFVAEIHKMHTTEKYRRKGFSTLCIKSLQMEMKFIFTSWKDSTASGKTILQKCGFVKDGDTLIWRRPAEEVKDEKSKTED